MNNNATFSYIDVLNYVLGVLAASRCIVGLRPGIAGCDGGGEQLTDAAAVAAAARIVASSWAVALTQ